MTKKELKEFYKKFRVPSFLMPLGTITHKDKKHLSRKKVKQADVREFKKYTNK